MEGDVNVPVLQMKRLRLQGLRELAQGCIALCLPFLFYPPPKKKGAEAGGDAGSPYEAGQVEGARDHWGREAGGTGNLP